MNCISPRSLIDRERKIHTNGFGIGSSADAASIETFAVIRHPSSDAHLGESFPRFAHQIAERRQRHQLPRCEKVTPFRQP